MVGEGGVLRRFRTDIHDSGGRIDLGDLLHDLGGIGSIMNQPSQVPPNDSSLSVDEQMSGHGNVAAAGAGADVHQVVHPQDGSIFIGEQVVIELQALAKGE